MKSNEPDLEARQGFYLPHWRLDGAIYHVVFRLADSVPAHLLREWVAEREFLLSRKEVLSGEQATRLRHLVSARTQEFLDTGHGSCILAEGRNAQLVANALAFFQGSRYNIHAWCVMPNHVHVVVEPLDDHELSKILHSWKSFSSHEMRKVIGGTGSIWHRESYDHIVRNERSYRRVVQYVLDNPLRANLLGWRWVGTGFDSS
jgi:REP element-mobilizing transposase RayT